MNDKFLRFMRRCLMNAQHINNLILAYINYIFINEQKEIVKGDYPGRLSVTIILYRVGKTSLLNAYNSFQLDTSIKNFCNPIKRQWELISWKNKLLLTAKLLT